MQGGSCRGTPRCVPRPCARLSSDKRVELVPTAASRLGAGPRARTRRLGRSTRNSQGHRLGCTSARLIHGFFARISTSFSNEGSMRLPPYIALAEIELPFSKWSVLRQLAPTLGVTWSLMRVVVSLFAYGRSQHCVCPHASPTVVSISLKLATGAGALTCSCCGRTRHGRGSEQWLRGTQRSTSGPRHQRSEHASARVVRVVS